MGTKLTSALLTALLVVTVGCGKGQEPARMGTGEAPAPGAAAMSTVPGLPDFPGATRVAFERKSDADDGWATVTKAEFTTSAAFSAVQAFYEGAIAEGGWTVSSVETRPDRAEWRLSLGTSTADVDLEAERGVVEIKLRRRDR